MSALIYQSNNRWRFATAIVAAATIHLAAIAFASAHRAEPKTASEFSKEPPEIYVEPPEPRVEPEPDPSDPPPTPTFIDETFVENTATPPPVRRHPTKPPLVRPPTGASPLALSLSAAKVLAVHSPRPEYPYEARRQKITGDGVATMTVDRESGNVTGVTMVKSTGNPFLDNAAVAGFRRWRFKPGTVSSVICPVTFTLTGASY